MKRGLESALRCLGGFEHAFVRFAEAETSRMWQVARVLTALLIALLGAAILATGVSHQTFFQSDSAFILDGGWRLIQGQHPHSDFYSPIGTLPLALVAIGILLAGGNADALAYSGVLALPLIALWVFSVASSRFSAIVTAWITVTLATLTVGTIPLGWPVETLPLGWHAADFRHTSYAMLYNRLGWALWGILSLHLVSPRGQCAPRYDGLSMGALLALLFFTKINYFAMGVVLLGAALWLRPGLRSARWALQFPIGLLAITLMILVWPGFEWQAWWHDHRLLMGMHSFAGRLEGLAISTWQNLTPIVCLLSAAILISRSLLKQAAGFLSALLVASTGLVVGSTNAQVDDIPGLFLAALILAELGRRAQAELTRKAIALLAGFALSLSILWSDVASVAWSTSWRFRNQDRIPDTAYLAAPPVAGMAFPPGYYDTVSDSDARTQILEAGSRRETMTAFEYAWWVNDGLDLLQSAVDRQDRVFVADFVNPFSFALELSPPRGDALWWHYGRIFDEQHFLPAERVFADVDFVMIPKRAVHPVTASILLQIYGSHIRAHYVRHSESELWALFEKR